MPSRDDSNFFSEENYNENFDDNEEDEDNDEKVKDFISKNEVLYTMEIEHMDNRLYKEVNVSILKEAVKVAKDSLFWRLYTTNRKINRILHVYYSLMDHVNFDKGDLE